jgi:long-subunit fatty acid transport protein
LSDGKLKIDDDDVAYGFNLGLMLTPRDGTRFGITYRSEVDLEFKDTASLKNIGPVLQGLLNASGIADSWLWSAGVAYDISPTDEDTRTPDLPLDRQIRIGTGVQYEVCICHCLICKKIFGTIEACMLNSRHL